jgi:hypothetical protein
MNESYPTSQAFVAERSGQYRKKNQSETEKMSFSNVNGEFPSGMK